MATIHTPDATLTAKLVNWATNALKCEVHSFERFSSNDNGFRALYARDASVLGWHVRRVGRREARLMISTRHRVETSTPWE